MDLTQRQALAELLRSRPAYDSPLAALVGDASANVRAGVGTAKAVTPTWRQKTAGLLQDGIEALGADRYRSRRIAETLAGGESSNLPLRMGLLDPTMIGAAFGRQEAPNMGPGAPSGLMHAATVFHGSPHKFDKFDSRKIGTGEGAQAYGHGLYLAESPAVAKTYSADRAYVGAAMGGKPMAINYDDPKWIAQKTIDETGGDSAKAVAHLKMVQRTSAKHMSNDSAAAVTGAIDLISSGAIVQKGSLYSVDLPDPVIARMLDYDKPVPETTRAAVSKAAMDRFGSGLSGSSGKQLYDALVWEFENAGSKSAAADATEFLRQNGVPGIRYLDGGSRGAGQGSSNFVVFPGEEDALRILTRNGAPLP